MEKGFGFTYFMAFIGTSVYYVQQSSGFWPGVVGVAKGFVWPAILMHKVFSMLEL